MIRAHRALLFTSRRRRRRAAPLCHSATSVRLVSRGGSYPASPRASRKHPEYRITLGANVKPSAPSLQIDSTALRFRGPSETAGATTHWDIWWMLRRAECARLRVAWHRRRRRRRRYQCDAIRFEWPSGSVQICIHLANIATLAAVPLVEISAQKSTGRFNQLVGWGSRAHVRTCAYIWMLYT